MPFYLTSLLNIKFEAHCCSSGSHPIIVLSMIAHFSEFIAFENEEIFSMSE